MNDPRPIRPGAAVAARALVAVCVIAIGCQSTPPPGLVAQGDAAFAEGAYRAADALYVRALEADPVSAGALHGRARVAVALRDPESALQLHRALARAHRTYWQHAARDDYAAALFAAGRARLGAGRTEAAVDALRTLRKVEPGFPGLAGWLARALAAHAATRVMHGQRAEALALYQEAIDADPGSVGAYVGAAEILIGTGRKQEALALLETARETHPEDTRVRALTMEAMGLY